MKKPGELGAEVCGVELVRWVEKALVDLLFLEKTFVQSKEISARDVFDVDAKEQEIDEAEQAHSGLVVVAEYGAVVDPVLVPLSLLGSYLAALPIVFDVVEHLDASGDEKRPRAARAVDDNVFPIVEVNQIDHRFRSEERSQDDSGFSFGALAVDLSEKLTHA